MIKPIVHDELFLSMKSAVADESDLQTAADLRDTLAANRERCVGMAANMIGVRRRVIIFDDGGKYTVMLNPEIVRRSERYETQEGCLSLEGQRKTERWRSIKVSYQNEEFKTRLKTYTGFTAQIIQHEIDHLNGIII